MAKQNSTERRKKATSLSCKRFEKPEKCAARRFLLGRATSEGQIAPRHEELAPPKLPSSQIRTHSPGQSRNENQLSTVLAAARTVGAETKYHLLTAGEARLLLHR